MLALDLEQQLKSNIKDGLLYPRYDGYSLYNVMPTIFKLFGLDLDERTLPEEIYKKYINKNQKIVLFLTDGFGYNQCKKAKDDVPFLQKFFSNGGIYPITSGFPSTTAASLTTVATGLTPEEHGLFEWNLYIEEIDQIIQTLPFSHLGRNAEVNLLADEGASSAILLDKETIYERLSKDGIKSYVFSNEIYVDSVYSGVSLRGANVITYRSFSDLIVNLQTFLSESEGPLFCYVYWPNIDTEGHNCGPKSKQYSLETKLFFDTLQESLINKLNPEVLKETLFLLTSDHGQISINPEETIYLNDDEKLQSFLEISKNNKKILPYGGPRDCFLKVKNEKLDEAVEYLRGKYGKFALISKTEEMIQAGLFGTGEPSERFLRRVGNIMILPHKNNTIWYEHVKGERLVYKGHHGGLSEDEMLIPFGIASFSDLDE
jgi:predicted AlkP superfamily pyrophosphatase or phosphodiesterase